MSTLSDAEVGPQSTEVLKRFTVLSNVTGWIENVLDLLKWVGLAGGSLTGKRKKRSRKFIQNNPRRDRLARREPGIWMSVAAPGTLTAFIAKFTFPVLNLEGTVKAGNDLKEQHAALGPIHGVEIGVDCQCFDFGRAPVAADQARLDRRRDRLVVGDPRFCNTRKGVSATL
jgi:hypothetical protein